MATPDVLTNRLRDLPQRFHYAVIENSSFEDDGYFLPANRNDNRDYRSWAREHFNPDMHMQPDWHPVVIDECCKIIKEFNKE